MEVPNKWTLLGGVIGAFITVTVVRSMADLGPARAAMLIVISQLIVAWVIELFGWFGVERTAFEWEKTHGNGHRHYRGDCFQMVKNFLKMCCKNVNFPLQ